MDEWRSGRGYTDESAGMHERSAQRTHFDVTRGRQSNIPSRRRPRFPNHQFAGNSSGWQVATPSNWSKDGKTLVFVSHE